MDMEQSLNLSKRGQITEQLVELPILRQVYDMIDAAGSKGLTNTEVSAIAAVKNKNNAIKFWTLIFLFLHLNQVLSCISLVFYFSSCFICTVYPEP